MFKLSLFGNSQMRVFFEILFSKLNPPLWTALNLHGSGCCYCYCFRNNELLDFHLSQLSTLALLLLRTKIPLYPPLSPSAFYLSFLSLPS